VKFSFCGPGFHSGTQKLSKRSCAEISCAAEEWENLPLPKKVSRILIAGSHADNLGYQCGGWTITWQGFCGNDATSGVFFLLMCFTRPLILHVMTYY